MVRARIIRPLSLLSVPVQLGLLDALGAVSASIVVLLSTHRLCRFSYQLLAIIVGRPTSHASLTSPLVHRFAVAPWLTPCTIVEEEAYVFMSH
mmetsp:Transcript_6844/g.20830  ORF Transcript_6844/g.20830 Transcript_6844/m.20830 type:complete len:93 (-) Transcript_6844:1334-1612(-)